MESSKTHQTNSEIPQQDIAAALKKKCSSPFVVLRYKQIPLEEKRGLLGDHSYLQVTYLNSEGNEEETSFFVKFFPKLEGAAKFAEGIGAFKKEMAVYNILENFRKSGINLVGSVTPRCYFSRYNEYFLLENLTSEGYDMLDKHKTLDYDAVLVILQALAKFHASSIIYESKRGKLLPDNCAGDFEESFFNDKTDFINCKGVEASIKCVIKEIDIFGFPAILRSGKSFPECAEKVCYKIYDLVKPSTRFGNVLTHGDLWATNFLLKRDPKSDKLLECKFIDFQCGRYTPPAQDVMSLLYLTTSKEFRAVYLYEVIGVYYSYLERHLKMAGIDIEKLLPFANFMNSCEEQKLFAIIQTAIYFPLILINNDVVESYLTEELFEDRSYLVLAHVDKDESYRKRLKDSIEDLMDYCEYL